MSLSPRWLLFAAALFLLGWLDYAPLWNPDEGRYASTALEMSGGLPGGSADWVVPHLNTVARLAKPPLIYWLTGGTFELFGPSEWASRLWPALAAVAVLFIIFAMGRQMFDEQTGIAGALIWSTSLMPGIVGRSCNTDMLLCLSMTMVFWGMWLAFSGNSSTAKRWLPYGITGLGMGLALLAKGPVGAALPLLIGFVFLCWTRSWLRVTWWGVVFSFFLAVVISCPWFIAMEKSQPGFIYRFIVSENFGRFSGEEDFHKSTPFWFYLPIVVAGLVPWTHYLTLAFRRFGQATDSHEKRALTYLWLWAGFVVLFFSFSGTKLPHYILPAFPAFALLLSHGILQEVKNRDIAIPVMLWLIVIASGAGLAYYFLNEKSVPREVGLPYAVAILGTLIVMALSITRFWSSGAAWKVVVTQFAGIMVLYMFMLSFAGKLTLYEDSSSLFRALKPHLKPGSMIIQAGSFEPTAIFYTRQPIYFLNFVNKSSLDQDDVKRSPYFIELESNDLQPLLKQKKPVFVLLRWRNKDYSAPKSSYVWARNNDFKLISNQVPPADFHYDFTAPAVIRRATDAGIMGREKQ
jgi:4-amino-4-deoxy-L-arabinose transferase-like glycosyltransferase